MSNYAIQIKNLTKVLNRFTAVNKISFTVKTGELFGLLGPNGAGKTTIINMLSTLLKAKYGYDSDTLIEEPLVEMVWMQFQAMTPFSNPAVEWENSDGNGLDNTWTVFFNVPLWKLKKSEEIKIQVPEGDECGKGEWSIWFSLPHSNENGRESSGLNNLK